LHGAPNLPVSTQIIVQIARVDPLLGWLTMDLLSINTLY
jgi:hypothetical protein